MHAGFFVATLSLGNIDLYVPLYKTVVDFRERVQTQSDGTNKTVGWDLNPYFVESGGLYLTVLVASFFALSSLAHLGNGAVWREYYIAELRQCRTPTRWIEYFFSATVMILAVGYQLGIRSRDTLVAIAGLIATTMPFGYWTEMIARPASPNAWTKPLRIRLLPWALGHVPQLVAWTLIGLQFYDGADPDDRAPWFVHVILWSEAVLFFAFGGAALLSQLGPPRRFWLGELLFQILSLVSKGLLGMLLLINVLMLSSFEDAY